MDRSDNFQIHCFRYRAGKYNIYSAKYWITINKNINRKTIWECSGSNGSYVFGYDISGISDLIREYIDSPRDGLLNKSFKSDQYGLTNILKKYDRRFKHDLINESKL